jgi:pimeloyl-ACP methyl ester carboxylesterase
MSDGVLFLSGPNGRIAHRKIEGAAPGVIWLGGFASDMTGTKASFLADWAAKSGRAFTRFDYSGHGASEGAFEDCTIGDWRRDALAVLDGATRGPQILVGSSMGAWIALHAALDRPARVKALILIAPAVDMTEALILPRFDAEKRAQLERDGRVVLGPETFITRQLVEDGRKHLLLGAPIPVPVPVRILQGMQDPDVPVRHALKVAESLESRDVEIYISKSGDHRLSTPKDLERLAAAIQRLSA